MKTPLKSMDSKPMAWLTTRPKRKTAKVRQMAVAFNTSEVVESPLWNFHGFTFSQNTVNVHMYVYIYIFSIISLYIVHQYPSRVCFLFRPQLIYKGKSTGRPGLKTSFLGVVRRKFSRKKSRIFGHHRRYRIKSQVLKNRNVL